LAFAHGHFVTRTRAGAGRNPGFSWVFLVERAGLSIAFASGMMPRMKTASSRTDSSSSSAPRGARAAHERWIAPHDPTLRERLEVAAAHLRIAQQGAASGRASGFVKREVEFADREILIACRALRGARAQARARDAAQIRMLEQVSRAAAELQRSTRQAARLLDEPIATRA